MKFLFPLLIVLFVAGFANGQPIDELLKQLDKEISLREHYASKKLRYIDSLKAQVPRSNPNGRYNLYLSIYDAYKSFVYDSAFSYARKLNDIGGAETKIGFVLVSAGMFNEALDTLRSVKSKALSNTARSEYFQLMARTYYDLADFNRVDIYRKLYTERAASYIDSALAILPATSVDAMLITGLRDLHTRQIESAKKIYETLLNTPQLSQQQFAIVASTLSFIYFYSEEKDKAKEMLVRAAIADIRSSTKETVAMQNLADMFYKEGNIELAYRYVQVAREDADFYGARQRQAQVAAIYPIIEGRQLSVVEEKRKSLLIYSSLITLFTISAIVSAIVIFRQNKKLRQARQAIAEANKSLEATNLRLEDANKIKEEYIWYYFNATAEYITKLDSLKKSLDLKLMTKKIDELRFTVDSINIKHEREGLYHNFDKVFLKLFPDFVSVVNSMLPEGDKIVLKEGQLLNSELRIFALIRMGIHDHERIAKILDYSVTTIYTYKTRVRNKAVVPHDEFDRRIMEVPAI